MADLLIISCSAKKTRRPAEPIPAGSRYTGVFYQVISRSRREGRLRRDIRIVILSAKFGLLEFETCIPCYEQRLTRTRVDRLRGSVQQKLREIVTTNHFERIAINVGAKYLQLLSGIEELRQAEFASGFLGERAQWLKAWLTEMGEQHV
jgi:hypothetical protein